ncbi:uncharacterized protein LOC101864488 [Aplysia californica]|uniref:Uncharacterized protein LOC101864488 n=1 Tax=Aplysia californica TaxID=6500 RepID=A0ABM0K7G0_APLCA|nr:uncharacterized protein LOC101864488 [Aplysia californica]XP_005110557.1 uncharacterized protein LOC101864488 [Aplysia californica]
MSWEDFISHVLATTSKVDKMVIYDLKGRPVAVTEDMETSQSEGLALVNCLLDPAKTLTKLHIGDDIFICIQGIGHTFIGTSVRNHSMVIVAHKDSDHVVVVIGHSAGRGSFIFELKRGLSLKAQGQLLSQQQQQQQQQLLPIDSEIDVVIGGAAASPESVLVDLMS